MKSPNSLQSSPRGFFKGWGSRSERRSSFKREEPCPARGWAKVDLGARPGLWDWTRLPDASRGPTEMGDLTTMDFPGGFGDRTQLPDSGGARERKESRVRAGGCAIVLSHQDVLIWVPLTHAGDVPLAHFESSLQAWQSRSWLARLGPQSLCHALAMAQTVSREPGPGLGR